MALQRSTGLQRTGGLSRTSALARGAPLERTGPPKPRSAKMEAVYKERRPLVKRLLTERKRCEFRHPDGKRCNRRSSQVHEIWTRARSGNTALAILLEQNLLALCGTCHAWITDHPAAARILGYVRLAWEGPPPNPDDDHPEAGLPLGQPRDPVANSLPETAR